MSSTPSPTLQRLARALSEEERNELYDKIMRSLSLESASAPVSERRIYHADVDPDRRREVIESELRNMSFQERTRVWFRRFLTGKSPTQVFVELKLAQLRRAIERSPLGVERLRADRVPAEVADATLELYYSVRSARPLAERVWGSTEKIHALVSRVLASMIPGNREHLESFISMREMEELYSNTESKLEIRNEVLRRLGSYVDGIHRSVFEQARDSIRPLYLVKDLLQLDFAGFLSRFVPGGQVPDLEAYGAEDPRAPAFRPAEVRACLDELEQLYCAVHLAGRASAVRPQIMQLLLDVEASSENEAESETGDEQGEELGAGYDEQDEEQEEEQHEEQEMAEDTTMTEEDETAGEVDVEPHGRPSPEAVRLADRLADVQSAAHGFRSRVPLMQLIKFHRRDPYHRILLYTPKLRLKQFYRDSLKIRLLGELDDRFDEVRNSVIRRLVDGVFGTEPGELGGYRSPQEGSSAVAGAGGAPGASGNGELGLPAFRYVRSLKIAYQMARPVYRDRYQDLIRLLIRVMPPDRKALEEELGTHAGAIEEISRRIEELDDSLLPDADDGKLFQEVRRRGHRDQPQLRAYRVMVQQKDSEARTLVREIREHYEGIRSCLQELISSGEQALQQRFRAFDPVRARRMPIDALLRERAVELANVRILMNQLLALEEGE